MSTLNANFSIRIFKTDHEIYTAAVRSCVQNFKSLALMKVKIEKFA